MPYLEARKAAKLRAVLPPRLGTTRLATRAAGEVAGSADSSAAAAVLTAVVPAAVVGVRSPDADSPRSRVLLPFLPVPAW